MTTTALKQASPSTCEVEGLKDTKTSVFTLPKEPQEGNDKILLPSFHAAHLEDLRKSGLSDKTIIQHGIKSVRPADITKRAGFDIPGLVSAYIIPFPPFNDGYFRLKAFYAPGNEQYTDGRKKPRYIQRKGTLNRLYIPVSAFSILHDTSVPLYITEGEKKALKATQEGLPTIAITGLWNWKQGGNDELIDDFNLIAWAGRTVHVVPDSDWLEPGKDGKPRNLKDAVLRLCWQLQERGAKTNIVMLPGGASDE